MEEQKNDCCGAKKEGKGIMQGIIYGLVPHAGCIAFILLTILGVSAATAFFKPLLMNKYFFYFLILLSFVFATISAVIYLARYNMLSLEGIKRKWKYLSVMYGTTIAVNILLFLFIFPLAANIPAAATGNSVLDTNSAGLSTVTFRVDIPCPGHSPLISEELKKVDGVESIKFRFPNYFDVTYDADRTNPVQMTSSEVFKEYPATVAERQYLDNIDVKQNRQITIQETTKSAGGCGCGGCSGSSGGCGGSCGGSSAGQGSCAVQI